MKLYLGPLAGELAAELPFTLMHPKVHHPARLTLLKLPFFITIDDVILMLIAIVNHCQPLWTIVIHCDPLWHCLWFSRNRSRRGKTQFLRRKVLVPITTQVLYKVDQKVDNGECDLIRKLLIQRVRTMGQRTCQVGKIRECTNKMKEEILIEKKWNRPIQ